MFGYRRGSALFRTYPPAFLLVAVLTAHPLCAEEHWISLTTPHFEMYTTNGASSGTRALQVFERVRAFFLEASPSKQAPDMPVRIIAFRSEKEFAPYRPNGGVAAYYQRSRKRDYIVMQDLNTDNYRTAVHEYTHLIVEHSGVKLPVWLNEGLADVYSSLEAKGEQTMVGRPLAGRLQVLAQEKWLDLPLLTSVGQDSPYYNDRGKMPIFYAESWALTHMLVLGSGYHDGFSRFVASVSAGNSAEASFASVYGKTLTQVRKDLDGYFQKTTVQVSLFNVKLEKINLHPAVADLAPLHTALALTDLLASQPGKAREAANRLNQLAAEYPQNAEIEESLGYSAWQSGNPRAAAAHFAKAAEAGIDDPEMLFHYATLIGQDEDKLQTSIAAVKKALALKPEYREAKYFLGMQEMNARQYGAAFSTLMSLKTIKPAEAFKVYSALAYCSLELKDPAQARKLGKQAQQYAGNDSERQRANEFVDYLDRLEKYQEAADHPEPAPKMAALPRELPQPAAMPRRPERPRVTGQAVALECRDSLLRLHIQAADKKLVFTIRDPKDIVVRNTKDGYVNFNCGPMKPVLVTVVFEADATGATAGLVRELDF